MHVTLMYVDIYGHAHPRAMLSIGRRAVRNIETNKEKSLAAVKRVKESESKGQKSSIIHIWFM